MELISRPRNAEHSKYDIRICHAVWPALAADNYKPNQYTRLATYVREVQVRFNYQPDLYLPDAAGMIPEITGTIRRSSHKARDIAMDDFKAGHWQESSKESVQLTACFAATLCATTNVAIARDQALTEAASTVWEAGASLRDALRQWFKIQQPPQVTEMESRTVDPKLTMSYLAVNHGFHVDWTNHLNEHLAINWKTKVISIYQHKLWLASHLQSPEQCILPMDLVGEALDTLNLLFPYDDAPTKSFLAKQAQQFYSLGFCGRERRLDLLAYPRWNRRLEELSSVLQGPRDGIRQLLPDRGRPDLLESVNFWIAVFVAGLTVTSFIFGVITVIYAKWAFEISKESLELTRQQYLLSLAQACSNPQEATLLPEFCAGK
ncbi:hypothetical protein CDEST_04445 [Colletotrichum destructivum]|uniref:Uncharacterized protein n=1 Tax=Colletotrichum destructivum TaxID=34406 RepID=A0AAX4I7T7_9PEZI|nr:hypothetical protein CDEST_04445 [Colletotrichum destructivum]